MFLNSYVLAPVYEVMVMKTIDNALQGDFKAHVLFPWKELQFLRVFQSKAKQGFLDNIMISNYDMFPSRHNL